MKAKILAILLFSSLITSMRAQNLCDKVKADGDLINAISSFAACSSVNTNYTYVIKNWDYYCKNYTARDDISDL